MAIIPFGSCLQILELGEHADPVTRYSHEIKAAFVIAIIQVINKLVSFGSATLGTGMFVHK